MGELLIGKVSHHYSRIGVAALTLEAPLAKGDTVRIRGHSTDLAQTIESMQIDKQQIDSAGVGDDVAFTVAEKVRPGDGVYLEASGQAAAASD